MPTNMHPNIDAKESRSRAPGRWQKELVVVAAAIVCASFYWLFVVELPGVDLTVQTGDETRSVGLADIMLTAGVAAVAGVGLLRVLERITSRALTIWTVVAVAFALLSLLGTLAATTATAQAALMGLHGVVAAVVIVALRRSSRLTSNR